MNKNIYTFCLGLVVGLSVMFLLKKETPKESLPANESIVTHVSPEIATKPIETSATTAPINGNQIMQVEKEAAAQAPTEVAAAEMPPEIEQEELPQSIDLTLSDLQVENMEQSLGDLQKDVSLFRYKKGWLVRFHSSGNLLSEIGVHDNDFIRFSQFEEMKKDRSKEKLVSRLEDVLTNLEH